ncbi:MAG: YkgJ family cysteine cluster protein [Thermoguttaceae bacterium]|nr:YkgJ family cysteine cluster protein [Thermoguttaceae bacterium]MDW8039550.1 YkgJ family cysteine cluster protein [Thermoguttaceae bacterium]
MGNKQPFVSASLEQAPVPVRLPTLEEHWDCHQCAWCCYGTEILLDEEDLAKLQSQHWDQQPEYQGVRLIRRAGLLGQRYRLAHRKDGTCVFLLTDGLCRIHRDFGLEAKPKLCQAFPFQPVPAPDGSLLVVRRSCPSAAAGLGRPVDLQRPDVQQALRAKPPGEPIRQPPEIVPGHRLRWPETLRITDWIERLFRDQTYPLVRRAVHVAIFTDLLAQCRPGRLTRSELAELVDLLAQQALQEAGQYFQQRRAPDRAAQMLFRRIVADYVRLHPRIRLRRCWQHRWWWIRTAWLLGRGHGQLPPLADQWPGAAMEALDRPLGPLSPEVLRPLEAYFEAAACCRAYSLLTRPGWPLVEAIRALVVGYPVGMWLVRFATPDRAPTGQDVIEAVVTLDRGERLAALAGSAHRQRLRLLGRLGQMPRLIAWYGR